MTSDCEADLTCFDMTCMDIPALFNGDECTMDIECGNLNGNHDTGECRNMMCGPVPARLINEDCIFDFECEEFRECRDGVCREIYK